MSLQKDLEVPDKIRLLKDKKQSNAPGTTPTTRRSRDGEEARGNKK
jgi:hypothetical protein